LTPKHANVLVALLYTFTGVYVLFFIFLVYNAVCLISK